MSLSYHDQHLAWQQRVNRQISAASRFYGYFSLRTTDSFNRSKPTISRQRSQLSRKSRNSNRQSKPPKSPYLIKTPDLRHTNIYAQVRGKYSRPAPILNQFSGLQQLLASKQNYLTSRPSTSGSMKRAKSVYSSRRKASIKDIKEDFQMASNRSLVSESKRPKSVRSIKMKNQNVVKKQEEVVEKILSEKQDGVQGGNEAGKEEKEEIDGQSQVSWVTTSSHRLYIQELERMLREERMKRIQTEKVLQNITENSQR